jgi:hypothetical protein
MVGSSVTTGAEVSKSFAADARREGPEGPSLNGVL